MKNKIRIVKGLAVVVCASLCWQGLQLLSPVTAMATAEQESILPAETSASLIRDFDGIVPYESTPSRVLNGTKGKARRLARETELFADGWQRIETIETAEIDNPDGRTKLRFFFGPVENIGGQMNQYFANRALPNAHLVDPKTHPGYLDHIHRSYNDAETTAVMMWRDGSGANYNIPNHIWLDYGYYRKELPEGMVAYKLIYTPDGYVPSAMNAFEKGLFQIETTMTGQRRSRVQIEQRLTNLSDETFLDFLVGQSTDTNFYNDQVGIRLIGNQRGLYIQPTNKFRLDYDFTVPNPPDNWMGGEWMDIYSDLSKADGNDNEKYRYHSRVRLRYLTTMTPFTNERPSHYRAFEGPLAPGQEIDKRPAGTLVSAEGVDTAIHMKMLPRTFRPNETIDYSYSIGIEKLSNLNVKLTQDEATINLGEGYTFKGTWEDKATDYVSLFYELDDGGRVEFAKNVPNTVLGQAYEFTRTIPKEALKAGTHVLKVTAVNSDQEEYTASLDLTVKSPLVVEYLAEDKTPIQPAETLYGKVGSDFEVTPLNLAPDYEFVKVEGASLNPAGNAIGTFGEKSQTIQFIYKEIPKEVTMTVKYLRKDTGLPLKNIVDEENIPFKTIENLVIGTPFNPEDYRQNFEGYDYLELKEPHYGTVPDKDFELIFYYDGMLKLLEVTPKLDFGMHHLIATGEKVLRADKPVTVEIMDTRQSQVDWELSLHVGTALVNEADEAFKGEVRFNDATNGDVLINDQKKILQTRAVEKLGKTTINWSGTSEGIYLKQLPGNALGTYAGSLTWTLTDGL